MLRADVLNRLAIAPRLSPDLTVYEKNVGCGVGVGRTKDGVGVGPAGVGTGVAVGVGVPPAGMRLVGSGTHAARVTAMTTAPVQSLVMRMSSIVTPRPPKALWTLRPPVAWPSRPGSAAGETAPRRG